MPGAPKRILVGPTTYEHFRYRHKDYYVPNFLYFSSDGGSLLSSPESSKHVWRYGVSAEHHNAVFFYNAVSRRSVWVLPVVHPDGHTEELGEEEVMHAVDTSPARDSAAAPTSEKETETAHSPEQPSENSFRHSVLVRSPPEVTATVLGPGRSHNSTEGDGEEEEENSSGREADAGPLKWSGEKGSAKRSRRKASLEKTDGRRVEEAVQRALKAETQPKVALTHASSHEDSHSRTSLQDRLAAWRARQNETASSAGAPRIDFERQVDEANTITGGKPDTNLAADPFFSALLSTSATVAEPYKALSANGDVVSPTASHTDLQISWLDQPKLSSPSSSSRTKPTAQERELAEAASLLHREKLLAMEQERAALECRRRALAVEQVEAEERTRLAQARTAAERSRLLVAEKALQQMTQSRLEAETTAAAEARAHAVNQFLEKRRQLEDDAQTTVADSFSYASRIATKLAAAVPRVEHFANAASRNPSGAALRGKEELVSPPPYRQHTVGRATPTIDIPCPPLNIGVQAKKSTGSGGSGLESSRETVAAPPPPPRMHRTLPYAAPHVYDGEVIQYHPSDAFMHRSGASGRGDAARSKRGDASDSSSGLLSQRTSGRFPSHRPLLLCAQRDGTGTQYYDPGRRYFFRGTWRADRRDGPGVLSLPSTAVQGTWRDDALSGPAVLQTRHGKATVIFASTNDRRGRTHTIAHGTSDGLTASRARCGGGVSTTPQAPRNSGAVNSTITGNAVAELDSKELFVGMLQEGRVHAPYVLQLGQGDYIEWLGGHSKHGVDAARGGSSNSPRTQPFLRAPVASTSAGTGECRIRFRNDDTYVGHVVNFQLHGFGYYRFATDGHSYTGYFAEGWPHGKGLLIGANGDLYRGSFERGFFAGEGVYASNEGGYVYEGAWAAGEMDGAGTLSFANGDVWKGTFKANRRVSGGYTFIAGEDIPAAEARQ